MMKGWGAQDDFQAQIDATNNDAIARHRAELDTIPSDLCIDCEAVISKKRKLALPNCCRCVKCQSIFENGGSPLLS